MLRFFLDYLSVLHSRSVILKLGVARNCLSIVSVAGDKAARLSV